MNESRKQLLPRVGHGFDIHGFEDGDAIVLAGVKIPYEKKFKAHSDGDVLIHALCDALLGAACLGDIGRHFPDNDKRFQDIDSRYLLCEVRELLKNKFYIIGNVDITVIAQRPHLASFNTTMLNNLAKDLEIDTNQVNIKATTAEGLGFVGREEGIAVHAIVLIASELK